MTAPAKQNESPSLRRVTKRYDVVVAGGGMSGVGAAVTAARHGAKTALLQDRSVLGGNGSKEIRVTLQGASGGANAIYFRETGLMEELLLENQRRNPEANAELWDTVLLEKVLAQPGLDLYLNSPLYDVTVKDGRIRSVTALTLQAETLTTLEAEYFIDCTGDGTLGFLAGAPYMSGKESKAEFGEDLAPAERQSYTLGGSILFYAKDAGKPVQFVPPGFAHKFTAKDFRDGRNPVPEFDRLHGGFWWCEWGGTLDTIHDNEAIKYELLRIAYGLFDYLKNDPEVREKNRNYTLEWVGTIPGKRESRRFIGDHILTQQDVVERREFADAAAFGGWNLDDHAPKGFFDDDVPPSIHTQIPGLYNIPLRSLYSKTVPNLFFAGRNVSATHVALTSARVMLTCAQMGEGAGAAAALCIQKEITPRELVSDKEALAAFHARLERDDHYVVGARCADPANVARGGTAKASSQLAGATLDRNGKTVKLDADRMVLFPAPNVGTKLPYVEVLLSADSATTLGWQLHAADGRGGTIPHSTAAEGVVEVPAGGTQWVRVPVNATIGIDAWHMLELKKNPALHWHTCGEWLVGVRTYVEQNQNRHRYKNAHSRFRSLTAPRWGGEGISYCVRLPENAGAYAPQNAVNGHSRPYNRPNLWASKTTDFAKNGPEWLEVALQKPAALREVVLLFDSDLDRHLSNLWFPAPYAIEPDLVKDYDLELRVNGTWVKVAEERGNYLRRRAHKLDGTKSADAVRVTVHATNGVPRAQIYEVRAYV